MAVHLVEQDTSSARLREDHEDTGLLVVLYLL